MTPDYLFEHWQRVLELTWEHLQLAVSALVLALVLALPLAILISVRPSFSLPVLGLLGIVYTIPALALLALMIPTFGLGRTPAILALALYAQIVLVRNVSTGFKGVDGAILEAAAGVGMSSWQRFRIVRLPLALPVGLAGIRIAAVATISLATVTAWIDAGGLGTLLFDGITRDNPPMILAGTIAIVALALSVDLALRLLERVTPAARSRRVTSRR